MAEVKLRNVSKIFGKNNLVIEDMNLDIHDGEFFTIVGPSGCGKSTILNMIAGLEEISKGEILFGGQVVNDIPPAKRNVAMVFQSYALYPHMSVYENIAFPLRMKKIDIQQIEDRVHKISQTLELENFLDKKPRELSGGQRQRVALGRALVRQPKLFLLDEPLSNLDAKLRMYMRAELKKLHRQFGITTIYVTHDQAEAMALSDRLALLFQGKVQQCDKPEVLYNRPYNKIVAEYIGSPSMNLFPAEIYFESNEIEVIFGSAERLKLSPDVKIVPKGSSILFGIRPEDIQISRDNKDWCFQGKLLTTEPLGNNTYLDIQWNNHLLKAEVSADFESGTDRTIRFSFNLNRCHLFDMRSGRNIRE